MNSMQLWLILMLIQILPFEISAQLLSEYHLLYDESAMKKYIYDANAEYPEKGFWDFRISVSKGKDLILRVINNQRYFEEVNKIEAGKINYNDSRLQELDFIKSINKNESHLNIAVFNKEKNNFTILPVKKIILFEENEKELNYIDDYIVKLNKNRLVNGSNLDSSGGRILYKGKRNHECLNEYHLSIYSKKEHRFHEDFFFLDKIGLTKIRKDGALLELSSIDNIPLKKYLKEICNPENDTIISNIISKADSTFSNSELTIKVDTIADSLDKDGFYTVRKEDNLYKIAKKFNTTIDLLVSTNNLTTDKLETGQKIKITDNNSFKDENPLIKIDPETGVQTKIHIVRQGENLWKISGIYKISTAKIKELNKLNTDNINTGQTLVIEILEKK